MSIQQQVEEQYKAAFKISDRAAVSALRMLKSAFKNQEIELGRELTDDESVAIVNREVKRRREALEQYQRAGRTDLAQHEQFDITLYSRYLPAQLTEVELTKVVQEAIAQAAATGPQDLGKVMGVLMPRVRGKADGAMVQALVKRALGAS